VALPAQNHSNSLEARRAQLRDALQAEWEYQLRTYPEFATYVGDTRYNDRLSDHSPEAIAKQVERAKQQLKVFEAIYTSGFPDEEVLDQQLMVRDLRQAVEGAKFKHWEMPVDQMNGVHLNYASMPRQMPFNRRVSFAGLHHGGCRTGNWRCRDLSDSGLRPQVIGSANGRVQVVARPETISKPASETYAAAGSPNTVMDQNRTSARVDASRFWPSTFRVAQDSGIVLWTAKKPF
jgi:hypothetical protein